MRWTVLTAFFAAAGASASSPAAVPSADRARTVFYRDVFKTHVRGLGVFSDRTPPLEVQRVVDGFRFAADLGCADPRDDARFCGLAGPKAWTDAEIDEIAGYLAGFERGGLGKLLARARANGFDTVVRETAITHFDARSAPVRLFYPNSLHSSRLIVIADEQFHMKEQPDWPLLHVLTHAADFSGAKGRPFYPTWSSSAAFLRMSGFQLAPDGEWRLRSMSAAQRKEFYRLFLWKNAEAVRASRASRGEEGRLWGGIKRRTDGFAEPFGLPSFHSLLNPHEAFAEWAAYAYFEPAKARAANPELDRWIETTVFERGPR